MKKIKVGNFPTFFCFRKSIYLIAKQAEHGSVPFFFLFEKNTNNLVHKYYYLY